MSLFHAFEVRLKNAVNLSGATVLRDYVNARDQMTLFLEGQDSFRPWKSPAQYGISAVVRHPDPATMLQAVDRAGLHVERREASDEYRVTLPLPDDLTMRVLELEYAKGGLEGVFALLNGRGPWV